MSSAATMFAQPFFHGMRADLKPGDLIVVDHRSNFTDVKPPRVSGFMGRPVRADKARANS
ncbi:hypothetical protein M2175_007269 [Bradyrhizobium elkanii]|nr:MULTISPECIES: hypothetical protein [Bradyrhizobium]MCS3932238.1 hypothetical protein [Bradyrhizobium elkanii]MCS3972796.1 hypothetical protein [Bradyrhizobium japonicum]